jgi:hypothetical protein
VAAEVRAKLGPDRAADESGVKRGIEVVHEPWRAELGGLHPSAGPVHLLEHDHASAGAEEVSRRHERVVTGADEYYVGLVWKVVHDGDGRAATVGDGYA